MSSHNDPLEPTPFDAVQPAPVPNSAHRNADVAVPRGTPVWVLPALGGLLLLAVLVIFWLPKSLESVKNVPEPTATETSGTDSAAQSVSAAGKPSAASVDASPWSDAQAARLRKEAQDMLAQFQ